METWLNTKLYPSLYYINPAIFPSTCRYWNCRRRVRNIWICSCQVILDLADSTEQTQGTSHFYYQSHDVNDLEHYIALRQLQAELNEKNTKLNTISSSSCLCFSELEPLPNTSNLKTLSIAQVLTLDRWKNHLVQVRNCKQVEWRTLATFDEEQIFVLTIILVRKWSKSIFAVRAQTDFWKRVVWNKVYR